jgi:NADPH:quinone reductase-like Zn-dependent oxidoreductase
MIAACLSLYRSSVTATASTKDKLDWLLEIPNGATHAVNYKTEDFAAQVKKTTNGKGVDVVIDFVGRSHWEKNIDSLAIDGRMTILSLLSGKDETPASREARCDTCPCTGNEVPSVNLSPILFKRLKIQGSTLRSRSLKYQTELIGRCVGINELPVNSSVTHIQVQASRR